jgi:hypothetical protein
VTASTNDAVLTIVLLALAVYFSVLVARSLAGYLFFRRIRSTALLTWPTRPPRQLPLLLGLGVVSAGVAALNSYLGRPFHHVYSQGVMSAYFIVMVPLTTRIQRGLYRDGVWAERGFLPYTQIGRFAFFETPQIVVVMVPRRGTGAFRLPVPAAEYGAVRKMLEEMIRARVVNMDGAILGL